MSPINSIPELLVFLKAIQYPVAVVGHIRPDGDAMGSAVGLADLLRKLGKQATPMTPDTIPSYLRWATEGTGWSEPNRDLLHTHMVITVDSADVTMIGPMGEGVPFALSIDHHESHKPYAEHYYVAPKVPSCSEIIVSLFQEAGLKPSVEAAKALYIGIMTDTGRFWWGGVTPDTMRRTAFLIENGADPLLMSEKIYANVSWAHLRLVQQTIAKAEKLCEGAIVLVALTEADFTAAEATRYDKEGLIDVIRNIQGVQVAVLLNVEKGLIKGSLRARREEARMDILCQQFGGGGHKAAAGMRVGIADETLESFLPRFKEALMSHWNVYGRACQ